MCARYHSYLKRLDLPLTELIGFVFIHRRAGDREEKLMCKTACAAEYNKPYALMFRPAIAKDKKKVKNNSKVR